MLLFPPLSQIRPAGAGRLNLIRMSKICSVTGKRPLVGNNVSHSNVKTKRRQMPNLQPKTLVNPATGKPIRIMVSSRGIRTITKWMKEGKKFDLTKLV